MAEIVWTEPTLNGLNEIADYIELSNPYAASSLVKSVFKKIERLEEHPHSGRKVPELESSDYREVIVEPCRIFYKFENNCIYILFVLRQERDFIRYLLK
ncbi:MAG: type II toxin-antitoxin system RelE/ParE family toxin [Aliiglaciecola sp.]